MKQEVLSLIKIANEIQKKDEIIEDAYNLLQEMMCDDYISQKTRKGLREVMDLLEEV
jgi:hypothetical protein